MQAGQNQTGLFTFITLLASEQQRHWSDCAYHGSRRSSFYIWAWARQKNTKWCARSEDSGQSGHSPSLIRVFIVCCMSSYWPKLPSVGQRRLWQARLGGCPGWSESTLCTQVILLFGAWGHFITKTALYSWLQTQIFASFEQCCLWISFLNGYIVINWIKFQMLPTPAAKTKRQ